MIESMAWVLVILTGVLIIIFSRTMARWYLRMLSESPRSWYRGLQFSAWLVWFATLGIAATGLALIVIGVVAVSGT